MSNSLLKGLAVVSVLALSTVSKADHTQACVRVYCKADVSTKLRKDDGHGKFYPAWWPHKKGEAFITYNDFTQALDKCVKDGHISAEDAKEVREVRLTGTNALKSEKMTRWIKVRSLSKSGDAFIDEKTIADCKEKERKESE